MWSEPLGGDGERLISVLCLKCVHRTAAVTVGGTSESTEGFCGVFIFFLPPRIQKGSGREVETCCQSLIARGEFMVFGFLIRLRIFFSSSTN